MSALGTGPATAMAELTLRLRPREARRLRSGHPWVFANEVDRVEPADAHSGICRVLDDSGRFLAVGYYNRHSLICARILTRDPAEEINAEFFRLRLDTALRMRRRIFPATDAYRWVYGEADELPGMVIDLYPGIAVIGVSTLGMEELQPLWQDAVAELCGGRRMVFRNDSGLRQLEGLPLYVHCPDGFPEPYLDFMEEGAPAVAMPCGGQKTGYFLDQRDNRIWARRLAPGAEVLDLFCYTGAWGLSLLHAGARGAVFVDSSAAALDGARRAVARLGADVECSFIREDAERALAVFGREGRRFEVVVADPPDLIPTRKSMGAGRRKYLNIFTSALKAVSPKGFALLSSCSYHLAPDDFESLLSEASKRAGTSARIVWRGGAAADHPQPVAMPEARYLKCAALNVG